MTAPSRVVRLRAMSRAPTDLRRGPAHRVTTALHAGALRAVVPASRTRSGLREPLAQRPHATPRLLERLADRPHDLLGARRVAVTADRLHRDVDLDAVDRAHLALGRH